MAMLPVLWGQEFMKWLIAKGIVPEGVRHVIIEATWDDAVTIYVEQYGTEGMIEVEPPPALRHAKVVIVGKDLGGSDGN